MAVLEPDQMNNAFAEAYNSGDIENLMALYEPDAILAPQPGHRAVGLQEIRAALSGFLALNGKMTSRNEYCMHSGDIALLRASWTLAGVGPNGESINLASRTSEVIRRQQSGHWLYVLDHAFGSDGDA